VKVRKSRWNSAQIKYKCDRGFHTEEFYKNDFDGNVDIMDVGAMVVDSDVDEESHTSDLSRTSKRPSQCELYRSTPKRRDVDYVEKGSDEFKGSSHRYRAVECSLSTDYRCHLNFGSGNTGSPRYKPRKDCRTVKRVER
jgi:hypothetical protein